MAEVTLVLFDIDGTLLRSGGSGRGAMSQAAAELYGRPDMFDGLSFAGAVDSSIVARALESAGFPSTPRRVGRLRGRYVRRLKTRLRKSAGEVCPGASSIIADVKARAKVGLLTGNWSEGARAKLDALGLWGDFQDCVGAYGGDAWDRDALVPVAERRARRRWGALSRLIVVGDTPADVQCARAGAMALAGREIEVLSVGVETGFSSPAELRAAAPDLQIRDFISGRDDLLSLIG
jgi:phosphoglycolate phosphatase